jgi:hypothetical protein
MFKKLILRQVAKQAANVIANLIGPAILKSDGYKTAIGVALEVVTLLARHGAGIDIPTEVDAVNGTIIATGAAHKVAKRKKKLTDWEKSGFSDTP